MLRVPKSPERTGCVIVSDPERRVSRAGFSGDTPRMARTCADWNRPPAVVPLRQDGDIAPPERGYAGRRDWLMTAILMSLAAPRSRCQRGGQVGPRRTLPMHGS